MNILDPRFKYVNSASTDIRKTFERARKAMAAPQAKAEQPAPQVLPLKRRAAQ